MGKADAPPSPVLKITNRSTKKPIKNLPTSIEYTRHTTVQDVKEGLARGIAGRGKPKPDRLGLYDSNNKLLKDRHAHISKHIGTGELFVKDLGPQISWLTVFIIEYAGPIFIHLSFLLLRPYLYSSSPPLSTSQQLSMAMIVLHFIKREYETIYIHKFSLTTMPARNIFKNSAHYWVLSGANMAYWVYSPSSYTAKSSPAANYLDLAGFVLYVFGEASNLHTHITLSKLRTTGGTERGIPKGYGFNLVTCPNYLFETIAWIGILLVTKSLSTAIFLAFSFGQMYPWAVKKEKALRAEFPDKYKKKKYVIIPSPGALIKALTG